MSLWQSICNSFSFSSIYEGHLLYHPDSGIIGASLAPVTQLHLLHSFTVHRPWCMDESARSFLIILFTSHENIMLQAGPFCLNVCDQIEKWFLEETIDNILCQHHWTILYSIRLRCKMVQTILIVQTRLFSLFWQYDDLFGFLQWVREKSKNFHMWCAWSWLMSSCQ